MITLLRVLLGLDGLGAAQRRSARRALASGDLQRMRAVGRALAAQMLQTGDLVRVMVNRGSSLTGPLCLHRRTARLLDLGLLETPPVAVPRRARPARRRPAVSPGPSRAVAAGETVIGGELAALGPVLAAMERAQNLGLGEPRSGEPPVILENVLELLEQFLPDLHLFALLRGEWRPDPESRRVHPLGTEEVRPGWASSREAGTSLWISSWTELPAAVRAAVAEPGRQEGAGEEAACGCAAVPLHRPLWDDPDPGRLGPEIGLLLAVPRSPLPRETVLRLGRRLSRFVTRRWRHLREVNQRIHTDSLTGIHNRAYFDLQLTLELERAKRGDAPLTLVLADLDHFKQVNDRHGHQVGDRALQLVARELLAGLRRIDHVCRIGGEEFALILPETSFRAAQDAVSRLLGRMDRARHELPGVPEAVRITLSFGAVTYPEAGSDPDELYRLADAMLYRSKRMGRNRCSFWNLHGEPTTLLPQPGQGRGGPLPSTD